jgi:hypothetical protein
VEELLDEYAGCLSSSGELGQVLCGLRSEWDRGRLVDLLFEPGALALDDPETMAGAWRSLASLPADMAREREVEAIWESEQRATRADAQNPAAVEEMRLWEA